MKSKKEFLEDLKKFESKLGFDPSEVEQSSEEWHKMKIGVISASNAHKLLSKTSTEKYKTYMNELIAEVCTGEYNDVSSKSMQWGKDQEQSAISAYEFHTGKEVYTLPFVYKDEYMRCGCSPDAVTDDRPIEAKAPKTSKVHVDFLFDGIMKKEYVVQCQYQAWIMDAKLIDFISYDPRMSKNMFHKKTLERDEKMIETFNDSVSQFIFNMDKKLISLGFKFGQQWEVFSESARHNYRGI